MVAARAAKKLTQRELGARIGVSQVTISGIESGSGSSYIPAVCRILKIPGPMYGWSELQQQWAVLGHRLEERSPATFKMAVSQIQQMLDELTAPPETPPEPPPPPPPKVKKPLRALGSANVSVTAPKPADPTLDPKKKR